MSDNSNMLRARKMKNDEFYTTYEDVRKEISHYHSQLKGKVVYCNCDDYRTSNFVRFFKDYYTELGIKGVYATNLDIGQGAYQYEYDGNEESITPLQENGDFRSEECIRLLSKADIVITNPPFSLFREFVAIILSHSKDFLVIGNKQAVGSTSIFDYVKAGILKVGYETPDDFIQPYSDKIMKGLCRWFTTLDTSKRQVSIKLRKKYHPAAYVRYDNYDAINIDNLEDIPTDYYGTLGVPVTFLLKHNDKQFEVVGIANRGCTPELQTKVYVDEPNAKDLNGAACIVVDGEIQALATRIFVRRKRWSILHYRRKSCKVCKKTVVTKRKPAVPIHPLVFGTSFFTIPTQRSSQESPHVLFRDIGVLWNNYCDPVPS